MKVPVFMNVGNDMLERLEQSFAQAARFSADAAHELQTPLTILQGELDQAVQNAPPSSAEQRRYSGLLEEVQRLKAIAQKLLLLARTDAGRLPLQLEPVDLSAAVSQTAHDVEDMAPHLQVTRTLAPGIRVHADADMLQRIPRRPDQHLRGDPSARLTGLRDHGKPRRSRAPRFVVPPRRSRALVPQTSAW
jgi:signal transduction histidine kinase